MPGIPTNIVGEHSTKSNVSPRTRLIADLEAHWATNSWGHAAALSQPAESRSFELAARAGAHRPRRWRITGSGRLAWREA
jgi:hypothetical protein